MAEPIPTAESSDDQLGKVGKFIEEEKGLIAVAVQFVRARRRVAA